MQRWNSLIALPLLCALSGCSKPPKVDDRIAPADVEELSALVSAAQKRADVFIAARDQGLRRAAAAGLAPQPGAAPCPEKVPRPEPLGDSELYLEGAAREAHETARERMNIVPDWAVAGDKPPEVLRGVLQLEMKAAASGPRHVEYERQSNLLRKTLTSGHYGEVWDRAYVFKLAREIGSDAYWGWELDIVTSLKSAPTQDGSETFNGGILYGTAYLWSFLQGRVICVARVLATNQDKLKLEIDPQNKKPQQHGRLNEDLQNEAYRAAVAGLTAVPPP